MPGKAPTPKKKVIKKAPQRAAAKAKAAAPSESFIDPRLTALAKLFSKEPRVTLGKAFSSVCLKVDGKIFAMVSRDKLTYKLPKARVDELVASGAGRHFEPGPGRVMKEWIAMDAAKPSAAVLAREACTFVGA